MKHFLPCLLTLCILLTGDSLQSESAPEAMPYPEIGIVPKEDTGALRFLAGHPEYDGRGIVVAIFDTGVDPGAPALQTTTDGKPKVIDIVDATGSGDVNTKTVLEVQDGKVEGLTERTLTIPKTWKIRDNKVHVGVKAAYELYPQDLVRQLQKERKESWERSQRKRMADLQRAIDNKEGDTKELQAQLAVLKSAIKDFTDPGPVHDCVVFHDGKSWQAAVDTDADGDFRDEKLLTNYRARRQYAKFDEQSLLNFSVNIYDDGNLLSIVTVCGDHGTHVAGIVAAHDAERPQRNGLAPGAQIVSVKIGDTHLDGMETGAALMRGLQTVLDNKCDLINMSYGEPSTSADTGELIDRFNELVRQQGVIFVASAGNSGPALSTVGSPGGTSSAVIGVGAYVSPAMMKAQYTLRDSDNMPGLPFTWTSRGPTTDGDWGVDIFAPGAAITSVPEYSRQPNRRMNGTSMASPNACGNIALLLSALKQEKKSYTPHSVLTSLQSTAELIPHIKRTTQGPGLLQVDKAYEAFQQDRVASKIEVDVRIPGEHNARGIYLREPWQTDSVWEHSIVLKPRFPNRFTSRDKQQYETELRFTVAVDQGKDDWIEVGENLILAHDGGSFEVKVDPTKLKPGVHTAEIQGFIAGTDGTFPIVRIPITVTKPHPVRGNEFSTRIKAEPGKALRHFLNVPDWARLAKLELSRNGGDGTRFFYLHNVQLVPGQLFEDHESKLLASLKAGEEFKRTIPVVGGRCLEVCLSQYWSSLGDSDLELEVEFIGVAAPQELHLPSSGAPTHLNITSMTEFESVRPQANLTTLKRTLAPTTAKTIRLNEPRDSVAWMHDGTSLSMNALQLEYELELDKKRSVRLQLEELSSLLYDSPVSSIRMLIYDENNKLHGARDMFADRITLPKGKTTVQVELRHPDPTQLDRYKTARLTAEWSLSSKISIPIANDRQSAMQGKGSFGAAELAMSEQATLWLAGPMQSKLPSEIEHGDELTGSLKFSDESGDEIPLFYTAAKPSKPTKESTPAKKVFKTAQVDWLLERLQVLDWEKDKQEINRITRRVQRLAPENRQVHVERLHLADNTDRKQRLETVIELADQVIDEIDQKALQMHLGLREGYQSKENSKEHKQREAEKKDLIDALYRKGRALAYMELPDVIAEHPIEDQAAHDERFAENFAELSKWVDTSAKDYFLLHIRELRRDKKYAQAIQVLNKFISSEEPTWLYHKKRRDLYELLGWDDWRAYEQNWMWRNFPKEKLPL